MATRRTGKTVVTKNVPCDKCGQNIKLYKGDLKRVVCETCNKPPKKSTSTSTAPTTTKQTSNGGE